jgi:RNA polymerase sigma factor (sigma-70 family)
MFPTTHESILEGMKNPATEKQAFERFDQLYREPIMHWCRSRRLQHGTAEDVTQAVLLTLWQALGSFEYRPERGKFRGYIATVLKSRLADEFRRQQRHPEPQGGSAANEMIQQLAANVDELASSIDLIPNTAEWKAVSRVQAKVDTQTWKCFELWIMQEWPIEGIMEATGKGRGAVYQAVHRVKTMIAEEWQEVLRERQEGS